MKEEELGTLARQLVQFHVLVHRKGVFNDFDVDFSEGRRLPAVHVLVPLR